MKKILIFVIILAISLCFISCQKEAPDDLVDTDKESSFSESEELTTPSVDTDAAVEIPQGERPLKTMPSVSEYEDFISSNRLPENFVYYDNIKEFGEFKRLVILSESRLNDYSYYMYTFVDEGGFETALYVSEKKRGERIHSSVLEIADDSDMRSASSNDHGYILLGGLEYTYLFGELHSIEWEHNGLYFTLYSNSGLVNYPYGSKGFISDLLDKNKAEATLTHFASKVGR